MVRAVRYASALVQSTHRLLFCGMGGAVRCLRQNVRQICRSRQPVPYGARRGRNVPFCHIVVRRRRCPVPQRIPGDGARLFQRIRCGVCGGRIGLCGLVLWMQSLAGDGHGRGMGYFVVGNAVGGLWRRLLLCSIFPDRDLTAAHILRDLSAIRPGSVVDGTVILCICIRPNRVSFAERLAFVDGHGVAACACFLRGSLVIHCGFPFLMELCRGFLSEAGKIGRDLDYPLYKTGKIWYPIRGRED